MPTPQGVEGVIAVFLRDAEAAGQQARQLAQWWQDRGCRHADTLSDVGIHGGP